ncbi:DUF5709 domain-containing protein [Pseudonocardia endophytica]|uniref:DUF5709 domain-containing protein n=1 Tax=Pseudonocardia endophytica TaxID=401976 RepID=A0A4R1HLR5_PSEEN|nr:DUF5709 domain-containing protein [Pseudonocardia endophytica]TCK21455.1 hypothetical protein EV378_5441 [Pseudonocardia endophytica]
MTAADSGDDTDQYAQLQPEDTLVEAGVSDVLDEGYSPPERPWNDRDHESLDERLADEEPDPWNAADPALAGDDDESDVDDATGEYLGDASDTDGELRDDEVGDRRAGRLTVDDATFDGEPGGTKDLIAGDAGIDGAGASAEEAAVHLADEE